MKNILCFFLFVLMLIINHNNSLSQTHQQWAKIYNGNANSDDRANKVITDKQGNIYVVGFATRTGTDRDFLTIKYDPYGDTIWTRYYAGPAAQFAYDGISDIVIDDSNNVYVFGSSAGTNSVADFVTIKYNFSGTQQWLNRYSVGPNTQLLAVSMKRDQQGNIYVTGRQGSSAAPRLVYLIKYNSNGVLQWTRTLKTAESTEVSAMALDDISNIYLTGRCINLEDGKIYVSKFNQNGDSLWCNVLSHFGISSNDLKVDQNRNIIICGSINNRIYYLDRYYMITIKYNTSGVQQWYNTYPPNDTGGSQGFCVDIDNNGNIYSSGTCIYGSATVKYNSSGTFLWMSSSPNTTIIESKVDTLNNIYVVGYQFTPPNTQRLLTMKIDPVGIGIWSVAYLDSTSRYGAGESLTLDNNLNVIVTGVLGGNGYTSDIVTVKYNQLAGIIRISDNYPVRFLLNQNYPNPFNPSTTIQFSIPPSKGDRGMTSVKLIIYDVLGREVATLINQQMQPGSYSVDWDASNYPSGIYFYKLEAGDNVQSKKMVLIK